MKKIIITSAFTFYTMLLFGWSLPQTNISSFKDYQYAPLRIGVGFEKSPYAELGFSFLNITDKGFSSGSFCFYTAGQLTRNVTGGPTDYLYGGKIGFETCWFVLMWGAELKYLTNEKESQLFFTPKAGISMLGGASLCYGYNTPTRKNKLEEIGKHQISLTVHLSKQLLRDFKSAEPSTE